MRILQYTTRSEGRCEAIAYATGFLFGAYLGFQTGKEYAVSVVFNANQNALEKIVGEHFDATPTVVSFAAAVLCGAIGRIPGRALDYGWKRFRNSSHKI